MSSCSAITASNAEPPRGGHGDGPVESVEMTRNRQNLVHQLDERSNTILRRAEGENTVVMPRWVGAKITKSLVGSQ